ncbi:MAG: methylenetetrahydrofolate reductase, partial [Polyangiales bacterium]
LTSKKQLVSIARTFHCEIPEAFARELESAKPEHQKDVGVAWTLQQTRELLEKGVPSLHYYVMSSAAPVNAVLSQIDL